MSHFSAQYCTNPSFPLHVPGVALCWSVRVHPLVFSEGVPSHVYKQFAGVLWGKRTHTRIRETRDYYRVDGAFVGCRSLLRIYRALWQIRRALLYILYIHKRTPYTRKNSPLYPQERHEPYAPCFADITALVWLYRVLLRIHRTYKWALYIRQRALHIRKWADI